MFYFIFAVGHEYVKNKNMIGIIDIEIYFKN